LGGTPSQEPTAGAGEGEIQRDPKGSTELAPAVPALVVAEGKAEDAEDTRDDDRYEE
jgi:hypothetical protein